MRKIKVPLGPLEAGLSVEEANSLFSPRRYIVSVRKEGVYTPPPLDHSPPPRSGLEMSCNGIIYAPSVDFYSDSFIKACPETADRFKGFFQGLDKKQDLIQQQINSSRNPGNLVYTLSTHQICQVRDSLIFQDLCLFYVDLQKVPDFLDRATALIQGWEKGRSDRPCNPKKKKNTV